MNSYNPNIFQKDKKISVDHMWSLIEESLSPWYSALDKKKMSDDQVLKLYYIITEANEMFEILAQIAKLKKEIDELTKE